MRNAIFESVLYSSDVSEHKNKLSSLGDNPPSNQEILNAAQNAYKKFQPAVDAATMALANIISSGSLFNEIMAIDQVNWQGQINKRICDPFYSSQEVKNAITASNQFTELNSFSVGVFSKALPNGGIGMAGFIRPLDVSDLSGISVKLDIFKHIVKVDNGKNLQFGTWLSHAGSLNDNVYGFYIDTAVLSVNINLKIFITPDLNPYGFVVSSGAKVKAPVGAAVFSGSTSSPIF